jgi:hypothetical protein
MAIQTSKDPVGAPIFYRDVPLMPSGTTKGAINPVPRHNPMLIKVSGQSARSSGLAVAKSVDAGVSPTLVSPAAVALYQKGFWRNLGAA